jgi:hypothetical protein
VSCCIVGVVGISPITPSTQLPSSSSSLRLPVCPT